MNSHYTSFNKTGDVNLSSEVAQLLHELQSKNLTDKMAYEVGSSLQTPSSLVRPKPVLNSVQKIEKHEFSLNFNEKTVPGILKSPDCSNFIVKSQNVKSILKTPENRKKRGITKNLIWKDPLVSDVKQCETFQTFKNHKMNCGTCVGELYTSGKQSKNVDYLKNKIQSPVKEQLKSLLGGRKIVSTKKIIGLSTTSKNVLTRKQWNKLPNSKTGKVNLKVQKGSVKDSKLKVSSCLPHEGFSQNERRSFSLGREKLSVNTTVQYNSTSIEKSRNIKKMKRNDLIPSFKTHSYITPVSPKEKQSIDKTLMNINFLNLQKSKPQLSVQSTSDVQSVFMQSDSTIVTKLSTEAKTGSKVSNQSCTLNVLVKRLPNEVYQHCVKKGYVVLKKVADKSLLMKNKRNSRGMGSGIKNDIITDKTNCSNYKILGMPSNLKENVSKPATITNTSDMNVFTLDADLKNKLKETILKNFPHAKSKPLRIVIPLEIMNNLQDLCSIGVLNKNVKAESEILLKRSPDRCYQITKKRKMDTKYTLPKRKQKIDEREIVEKKEKILRKMIVKYKEKEKKKLEKYCKKKVVRFIEKNQSNLKGMNCNLLSIIKNSSNLIQELQDLNNIDKTGTIKKLLDYLSEIKYHRNKIEKKRIDVKSKTVEEKKLHQIVWEKQITDYSAQVLVNPVTNNIQPEFSSSFKFGKRMISMYEFTSEEKKSHKSVKKKQVGENSAQVLANRITSEIQPEFSSDSEFEKRIISVHKSTMEEKKSHKSVKKKQVRENSAQVLANQITSKIKSEFSSDSEFEKRIISVHESTVEEKKSLKSVKKKRMRVDSSQVLVNPVSNNIQSEFSSNSEFEKRMNLIHQFTCLDFPNKPFLKQQKTKYYADDLFTDMSIITDEKFLMECVCQTPNCNGYHPKLWFFS